ncbi:thioesterase family protein [Hypoxylon trugodes]|uniref:thioesterase family protein n=1 Tax=Hypoxylon trugodes TaxID=326681 RepID=UPI0021951204|nr:thioesterase family protein [Hypoxylon trugodes]KAI1394398.1 thioesterase family protein [Hypoxylon trugodes]
MANILRDQINLKQTSSHTYTISTHPEWAAGLALHGGCVAAAIHHAASTHLSTTLAAQNQPDILTLHIEFLRACDVRENGSVVTVTDLKLGLGTSTIQLVLSQSGKTKVLALATSTNFDKPVGPSAPTAWSFHPPPKPAPDFAKVLAHQPDENWIPARILGDVLPFTHRILYLNPREGFKFDGVCDAWNTANGEPMDATFLAFMTDIIPSMSDTLLRNGGLYDAHRRQAQAMQWDQEHPGVPVKLVNTLKEAMEGTFNNFTVTLDIEFKRRLPKEGVRWVFERTATRMLEDGRMDVDVTICDEMMAILCLSRQVILVLDAKRRFGGKKPQSTL